MRGYAAATIARSQGVLAERRQQLLQFGAGMEHPCLHRIDWARGYCGDFLVRAPVKVRELHNRSMLRGQVPQSLIEQVAQIAVVALFHRAVGTFNDVLEWGAREAVGPAARRG